MSGEVEIEVDLPVTGITCLNVAHGGYQGHNSVDSRADDGQGRRGQQGPPQSQSIQGS